MIITDTEKLPDPTGRGYLFAVTDDSDYIVPNALHIQRDDSMAIYPDDESAADAAEADGVKLIYGMPEIPDGVYLDTPENRAVIEEHFNTRDNLLAQIAKRHCRFETLETRSRDSLDFREVSVWGMKSALEEAYNAGIAYQKERTKGLDAALDSNSPGFEALEQRLRDRLADNYNVYKREMLELGKEGLFYAAAEILPVQEAYSYFTHEHVFLESDVDFLLKFENPLELISDRWSSGPVEVSGRVDAIFADMERTLQNGGYTLMPDDPAPEPARGVIVGSSGEKPSVLDRIKQHAREQRDRTTAPKDKADRKKSGQEH